MNARSKQTAPMNAARAMAAALMILAAASVSAQNQNHNHNQDQDQDQDQDRAAFVPDVVRRVVLDPTTSAPAIVAGEATHLDWRSSQVFFRNGSVEQNPRFTISGRGDDTAISYAAGNRRILKDAIANLQLSLVNNVSAHVMERLLMPRYPRRHKLLRTIGWIERSTVASYWSYRLSAGHFRQWQENERRAGQLGHD
jgi:hypothetical protein